MNSILKSMNVGFCIQYHVFYSDYYFNFNIDNFFSENRCLKWKDTALYLINSIDDSSIYIPQLSNSACDIVIVNSTLLPSKKNTLYHYISLDFVVESTVCS